ncbi:MAG: DUF2207 domain-containing protein [Candidatus Andeanibacterium colombiense]|uniref:DUF2207 domain-containing protein n=1 Tax=Candidatus Andeanibacterium colombiense TaxID=3121345 RepID=A0AAJ5X6V6_9SPHN|nr:MAG: DUF2207 domain-containing protein [Sphingomonadaceae bacterium]
MRTALRSLFVLLFLLLVPAVGETQDNAGEERILNYLSTVTVAPSGDLDVTETIRIVALNQRINHGIYRDFPTSYGDNLGHRIHVGFAVVSVQRNGKDEEWSRETLSNGVRIRIGSADTVISPGVYTYAIHYRTSRQVYYGPDHDELYWNVTGNGWIFPIDHAEARITLPKEVALTGRDFWTGAQGSTAKDAEVAEERPGYIAFRTTRPLGSEEGLTVSAEFPKGVLAEPGGGRKLGWWIEDWGAIVVALGTIAGLVAYYVRAWAKAGRNPRPGTVVPIFSPPDDLSPAAMRYVSRMSFDNRCFSAAMVFLGVKGQLRITKQETGFLHLGSTTTLSRTELGGALGARDLPAPEVAMRDALFAGGDTLELKQENHTTLQAARSALQKGLGAAYDEVTYRKNTDWALYGLGLLFLAVLATAVIGLLATPSMTIFDRLGPPLIAVGLLVMASWVIRSTGKGWFRAVAIGILAIGALAAAFETVVNALNAQVWALFIPLLTLPLVISAFWWMYAPTREGRALMDRIAGFRQYLSITEEERLDRMNPPEKTPELFERYLPYAIALDVENRWAEKFAAVLAAAAAANSSAGTMLWYSGSGNVWDDPQGFASDIGGSLASTVSSASSSPSSGGSGGGGSSGGGGGGGGGGGW